MFSKLWHKSIQRRNWKGKVFLLEFKKRKIPQQKTSSEKGSFLFLKRKGVKKMKKILISLATVVVVAGGVAVMSAFEAHVINVTAHIENALSVSPDPLPFGTVFPQEYLEKYLTVQLSDSFMKEDRVDDVKYVIKQKMKPCPITTQGTPIDPTCVEDNEANTLHNPTGWHYQDLCRFLSKLPEPNENDQGVPSYYDKDNNSCRTPEPTHAQGILTKIEDISDTWTIDLKVPPVQGYVGQDWPESCMDYVVENNDQTYGCDLWVEVTGISPA